VGDASERPSLTVSCPAYNEEEAIETVVADVLNIVPKITDDFEFLIVNDGSTDRTGSILNRLADEHPQIRVIHHPYNLGFAGFALTILNNAKKDCLVGISADGEIPVELFERQYARICEGYDVVVAVRSSKPNYSAYRKLVSYSYNESVRLLFGESFQDAGNCKMYRCSELRKVVPISRSAFMNAELLIKIAKNGGKIGFVPMEQKPRLGGIAKGANWRWIRDSATDLVRVAWQVHSGGWRPS
tara:strand:+ start:7919 stop:8647 length:729 start_codon:yes stop_codon:yes gene_type:complete